MEAIDQHLAVATYLNITASRSRALGVLRSIEIEDEQRRALQRNGTELLCELLTGSSSSVAGVMHDTD